MPVRPDIAILKDGFFKNPSNNSKLDFHKNDIYSIIKELNQPQQPM